MLDVRILLALLAVLYCQHSAALDDICDDDVVFWQSSRALDLEASKGVNATVAVIDVFSSNSAESCAKDCCQNVKGNCSVASFQVYPGNGTCYLYRCSPEVLCILTFRNGTDTYFAPAMLSKDNDSLQVAESSVVLNAVHGDGTKSKPRKGVLSDEEEEKTVSYENSTVQPRKGVDEEHNSSVIKPRKGVLKEDVVLNNDIFTDDQSVTNSFRNENVVSTPQLLSSFVTEPMNLSTKEIVIEPITRSSSTTASNQIKTIRTRLTHTPTTTTGVLATTTLTSVASTISPTPTVTSQIQVTQPVHYVALNDSIDNEPLLLVFSSESPVLDGTVKKQLQAVVEHVTVPSSTPESVVELTNWELVKSSSSLHLVIGLVLGLLLLLSVLGVVAKRMHDSWQRRHYHRMDFLIDGMYHGES